MRRCALRWVRRAEEPTKLRKVCSSGPQATQWQHYTSMTLCFESLHNPRGAHARNCGAHALELCSWRCSFTVGDPLQDFIQPDGVRVLLAQHLAADLVRLAGEALGLFFLARLLVPHRQVAHQLESVGVLRRRRRRRRRQSSSRRRPRRPPPHDAREPRACHVANAAFYLRHLSGPRQRLQHQT